MSCVQISRPQRPGCLNSLSVLTLPTWGVQEEGVGRGGPDTVQRSGTLQAAALQAPGRQLLRQTISFAWSSASSFPVGWIQLSFFLQRALSPVTSLSRGNRATSPLLLLCFLPVWRPGEPSAAFDCFIQHRRQRCGSSAQQKHQQAPPKTRTDTKCLGGGICRPDLCLLP